MVTPPPELTGHGDLRGRRILICRPRPEAERLAGAFERAGAEVRLLPMLEREPITDDPVIRTQILNIDEFEHVIAVSPYAAALLIDWLDTWWPQTPTGILWYGVGSGTASVLSAYGLDTRQPDQGHDSEALLALPELADLTHQKALIVRGDRGRELIPDTLRQRGARVTVLPLYRRYAPEHDEATLEQALTGFDPDAVVTLSGETLNNFMLLGNNTRHTLENSLAVVPVQRIADQARDAGFRRTCVPESLADDDIVAAVAAQLASLDVSSGKTK